MRRQIEGLLARRPEWLPRPAALSLLGLGAFLVAYLLLVNATLNSALGPWLVNRHPEKLQAGWRRAWSWYPGHFDAQRLRLRGHTGRTLWNVHADEASGRIALLPLLVGEVRIPRLRVSGAGGGVNRLDVQRQSSPARRDGWILRIPMIEATDLRHVHVDSLVLVGPGVGSSGFVKQFRGGPMELFPTNLLVPRGRLDWQGETLMGTVELKSQFAMARHERADAPGLRKFDLIDGELTVEAETVGIEVDPRVQGLGWKRLVPGPGSLAGTVRLKQGVFAADSELRLQLPVLTSDQASGRLLQEVLAATLRSDGRTLGFQARLVPQTPNMPSIDADLRVDGAVLPLTRAERAEPETWLHRTSGRVLGEWHFGHLRWLADLVGDERLLALEGAGTVQLELQLENGRPLPGSRLLVPGVTAQATVMGHRVSGSARAELQFEVDEQGRATRRLDALIEHFGIADANNGRSLVEGENLRLWLRVVGRAGAMRAARDSFDAHLGFADARITELANLNRYLPVETMRFTGGAGRLSGDLYLDENGEIGRGTVRIASDAAALRFADFEMQAALDAILRLQRADLDARSFVIDGSRVELADVSFGGEHGLARDGWWTQVELERARIDLAVPVAARGSALIRMADAGFLLALYSRDREYPRWVRRIVDAGQADMTGEFDWNASTLVLDDLVADNERFELRARMHMQEGYRNGVLYARWGALGLGAELDGEGKELHLVEAREWYDAQAPLLN